jgi:uncharacterized C2H2 Zn-finger protein
MTECDPKAKQIRPHLRKCPVKGCKERLTTLNTFTCAKCRAVVCLAHRFEDDHQCTRVPPRTGLFSRLTSAVGSGAAAMSTPPVKPSAPSTFSASSAAGSASVAYGIPSTAKSSGPGAGFAPAVRSSPVTHGPPKVEAVTAAQPPFGGIIRNSPPTSPMIVTPPGESHGSTKPFVPTFGLGLPASATQGGHGINSGSSFASSIFGNPSALPVPSLDVKATAAAPAHAPHLIRTPSNTSVPTPTQSKGNVAPQSRGSELLRSTAAVRARPNAEFRGAGTVGRTVAAREACPTCGATFADISSLISHSETEHRPPSEVCPHCSSRFADVVQLVHHVESAHGSPRGQGSMVTVGGNGNQPDSGCRIM